MKKILVVDDTKAILKMAKFVLNDKYDVYLSNSGELALEILNRKPIDIVLMDVDMPDMDGVETVEKIRQMENIKDAFCERDSKNADTYEENFRECEMKINELCNKYNEASQEFSDRNIIVAHAAYGYLCDAFNLNQTPIEGMHGEGGASPARMAEVVNFIRDNDVKYIFATSLESGKTMETIAKETDTQILVLNPFEGDTDGKDYFSVMEENLTSLKKALN